MIIGISSGDLRMQLIQTLYFSGALQLALFLRLAVLRRVGLIIEQIHIVADHIVVALLKDPPAEVDISAIRGEILLVKASDLPEQLFSHHDAGAAHGQHIADALIEVKVIGLLVSAILQFVHDPALNRSDTRMLDDIGTGIEKLHANCTDIGELGLLRKVGQPSLFLDDNIVVHEKKHLAVRVLRAEIIECRHIKAHSLIDIEASAVLVDLFDQLAYFSPVHFIGAVIHNDDLMGHRCVLLDRADAARKHFRVILTGNYDADQSRICGVYAVTACQRLLDQVSVPQLHSVISVIEHFRNMADRELIPMGRRSLGVASVCLRKLKAERAIDPRSDRPVVLIGARPLLVQTVLSEGCRALVGRGPSLSGIDHGKSG